VVDLASRFEDESFHYFRGSPLDRRSVARSIAHKRCATLKKEVPVQQ